MDVTQGRPVFFLVFMSVRYYCVVVFGLTVLWILLHGDSSTVCDPERRANEFIHERAKREFTGREAGRSNAMASLRIFSWNGLIGPQGKLPYLKAGLVSRESGCLLKPQHSCIFVHGDRTLYNSSDAVIFNEYRMSKLPPTDIPHYRPPGQKWVFYQRESQTRTNPKFLEFFDNLFNVTATFKFDSDVQSAYGPVCTANGASTKSNPVKRKEIEAVMEKVRQKTGLVAWFVSNCRTPSLREKYVAELQRYIPVDIYGRCGNMTCKLTNLNFSMCDYAVSSTYKFYLSFENSLCRDYVTEKFFRMHSLDTVAVVRGEVDYTLYAPPGTYIDVRDFPSVKHLAEYLKLLDARPDLYVDYLLRKRAIKCRPQESFHCRLCRHLHAHAYEEERVVLAEYWNKTKECKTADEFNMSVNRANSGNIYINSSSISPQNSTSKIDIVLDGKRDNLFVA